MESWIDYELPRELIAQQPLKHRADARLMVVDRARNAIDHHHVRDLPSILEPPDRLVLNDTRVLPARLFASRDTGGRVELLLLEPDEARGAWLALVRAGWRLRAGETLHVDEGTHEVVLQEPLGGGHKSLCQTRQPNH